MSYTRSWRSRALRSLVAVLVGATVATTTAPALAASRSSSAPPLAHRVIPGPPTWPLHPQPLHAPKPDTRPAATAHKGASGTDIALVASGALLVAAAAGAIAARSRFRTRRSRVAA